MIIKVKKLISALKEKICHVTKKHIIRKRRVIFRIIELFLSELVLALFKFSLNSIISVAAIVICMELCIIIQKKYENDVLYKDDITPLYFRKKIAIDIEKKIRKRQKFAVVYIDFKEFKYINDTYGHLYGDEIIRKFGEEINKLPKNYCGYRHGGDEFIVIINNYNDIEEAVEKLFSFNVIYGENQCLIYNAGVVEYPIDGTSAYELVKGADDNMRIAKDKNMKCYFSSSKSKPSNI